jgi:ferredoxin
VNGAGIELTLHKRSFSDDLIKLPSLQSAFDLVPKSRSRYKIDDAELLMNSFQFKCIGCGKCCNSTPVLALSEIPKFVDKFIIMIRVMVSYVKFTEEPGSVVRRQFENFSKLGGMHFSGIM